MGLGSVEGGVELSMSVGHLGLSIVLSHLGERVAVLVQLVAGLVPPHGEVLLDRSSKVGAVRSWLTHELMERLARALPV